MSGNQLSSVTNAVRLLRSFNANQSSWGVSDLARHLDLNKSTVHRILTTLTAEGLLDQHPETGRYQLSLAVFDLAAAVPTQRGMHEAVLSPMTDLRNATGETVHVAVLDGRQVVYIERLDSPNTLRLFAEIGRRNDAHCTSTGKVLMAYLAPEVRERLLTDWELRPHTSRTIVTIPALREQLDLVRRLGYAENRHESEDGVISIAAPIRDNTGRAVAALSVAGPADRLDGRRTEMIGAVVDAAMATSKRLGYSGARR